MVAAFDCKKMKDVGVQFTIDPQQSPALWHGIAACSQSSIGIISDIDVSADFAMIVVLPAAGRVATDRAINNASMVRNRRMARLGISARPGTGSSGE